MPKPQYEWKESEKSRAERIAEATAEYDASKTNVTSDTMMYLHTLNIMSEFSYTTQECLYLAHRMPDVKELDTFQGWNERGFRINKGEKGLTLLDYNKGEDVYFDVSQTNAPNPKPPQKEIRLPKEKVRALLSNNIRLLTATKEEFTRGQPAYFDPKYNSVILDRNTTIEALFPVLAKELAHAYIYSQLGDKYNRKDYENIAEAVGYIVCKKNDVKTSALALPSDFSEYSPDEVKNHFEQVKVISDRIQDNIDYFYVNGKNQFEKPKPLKRAEKTQESKEADTQTKEESSKQESESQEFKENGKHESDVSNSLSERIAQRKNALKEKAKSLFPKGVSKDVKKTSADKDDIGGK